MIRRVHAYAGWQANRQSGAVLVVGLIILVILTILGLAYGQGAILQERLAGNFRDLSQGFQSTEAGARWGMAWLQSLRGNTLDRPYPCEGDCDSSSPVWSVGVYPANVGPKQSFWSDARQYGVDPATDESLDVSVPAVNQQPRFILEQQFFRRDDLAGDPQKGVAFYRVTAKGVGQRPGSDAVVRSVMAKRFE